MGKICSNCGKEVEAGNVFCGGCGRPVNTEETPNVTMGLETASTENTPVSSPKKKRIKKLLLFYTIGFFVSLGVAMTVNSVNSAKETSAQSSSSQIDKEEAKKAEEEQQQKAAEERWLEFDSQTWEAFTTLYTDHNKFMNAISSYADGKVDELTFYDYCGKTEKHFAGLSTTYNFGTNSEENTYLSSFSSCALADQQAGKYMVDYLESGKDSDLSKAQEQIQRAKEAITTIAQNRGILLAKTSLTDEEIKAKIEQDADALDKLMQEN